MGARTARSLHGHASTYVNVVGEVLSQAEIVFDKFHVLQHASAAIDEVRRQEFFRAGAAMREHGRGKPRLLLRRWKTIRGSKRAELQALFAVNCSASSSIGSGPTRRGQAFFTFPGMVQGPAVAARCC